MSWNSRGLRGSTFEQLLNITNDAYKKKKLAIIQKIPTPIKPVQINNQNITLAYFEHISTVDYIGLAQGVAICFDAKEVSKKSLPLQNIHAHQIQFMEDFELQQGVSFLLVHFTQTDEYFFLPFGTLKKYWDNAQCGGRKSIPYTDFDKSYLIDTKNEAYINYLEILDKYLGANAD